MKGYDDTKSLDENLIIFFRFAKNPSGQQDLSHQWSEHYSSICNKWTAINLLRQEVIDQIPNWHKENEEIEARGYVSGFERTVLLIRYQTFLNIVYAICENLALLGCQFVPNLSPSYNAQIKKGKMAYLKEKYPQYAEVLEKNDWYEQMHIMRSESTHFFDGFVYINDIKKPGILFQNLINRREGVKADSKIDIPDIEVHVNDLTAGIDNYIKNLCAYLFTFIQDDFEMQTFCHLQKKGEISLRIFGPKVMTFAEYCNGGSWRCKATTFPCVLRDVCQYSEATPSPSTDGDDTASLSEYRVVH